jgi:hypothetical protein
MDRGGNREMAKFIFDALKINSRTSKSHQRRKGRKINDVII